MPAAPQPVELSRIPTRQRRFLALLLAPVGVLLLVAGALPAWFAGSVAGHAAGGVVLVLAILLLGIAHGLFYSARRDESAEAERRLDEAILSTPGAGACGSDCASCSTEDCAVKALPRR